MRGTISCDIFCRVIDNLGDAGVTWRLARQLAQEHGWRMRLIIDDPSPIPFFSPDFCRHGVTVLRWDEHLSSLEAADVVIEAFACDPPAGYLARMARRDQPPVWINLEYLSAEGWIVGCHGLPSPQPATGLVKHFFFPGFVPGTGGLLREKDFVALPALIARERLAAILSSSGTILRPPASALWISLFCYDNSRLGELLQVWTQTSQEIFVLVTEGIARRQVEAWLGLPFPIGGTARRGALSLYALPFLTQDGYDELLASCDLNFVRGEDSFVRAQWAERPFVWQAYPQPGNVHQRKLEAFLALYEPERPVADFFRAWNGFGELAWDDFAPYLPTLAGRASSWALKIRAAGDLASNLVKFCHERL